jgi:uroporphyrinogen-III decarboxylase
MPTQSFDKNVDHVKHFIPTHSDNNEWLVAAKIAVAFEMILFQVGTNTVTICMNSTMLHMIMWSLPAEVEGTEWGNVFYFFTL